MIRAASASDAALLAALHAETFGDASWSEQQISGSLSLATSCAWLAEEESKPQGFILLQLAGGEAEILTLCVASATRRQGIAQALWAYALKAVQQKNIRRVFLEVAEDNAPALALYKKAGFQPNGKRKAYYHRGNQTIDAVMLNLDLR